MQKLDLLVGRSLSDTYRVVRQIAQGGMGAIYEATHLRLPGKRYALKVLKPGYAESSEVLTRFRREAEITSRLGHEHIIEIHDFNITEGLAYLVMEMLEGEDLASRLKRQGPLAADAVLRIVDQVASALDAAHGARIVHRDLKPQNIFLCRRSGRDDHVKVLDFGISKILDSTLALTQQDALVGTPYYMAPEQAEGNIAEIDPRADVFALGSIAWEMLAGKPAFAAPTLGAVLYNVCLVDPPDIHLLRPDVPPAMSMALRRALAKDRAARTASASALARELTAGLAGIARNEQPASPAYATAASVAIPAAGPFTLASSPSTPRSSAPWRPPGAGPSADAGAALRSPWDPLRSSTPSAVIERSVVDGPPAWSPAASLAAGSVAISPRPRRRVAVIAVTASAATVVAVLIGGFLGRSVPSSNDPAAVTPAAPTAAAIAAPPRERTVAPLPAGIDEVALSFTVEPAGAGAELRLDDQLLTDRQVRRTRSQTPMIVTATAAGYTPFRTVIVADKDQAVTVRLQRSPAVPGRATPAHSTTTTTRAAPQRHSAKPAKPVAAAPAATAGSAAKPGAALPPAAASNAAPTIAPGGGSPAVPAVSASDRPLVVYRPPPSAPPPAPPPSPSAQTK